MAYAEAKEGKFLYVRTSIGNKTYYFQCKVIEKDDGEFILREVEKHDDEIRIINAPMLIMHDNFKTKITSQKR